MNRWVEETFDHSTGMFYIKRTEDVEPLIEEMALERSNGNNGWTKDRTMRKIGSIPLLEVERVLREKGINLMANTKEAHKYVVEYLKDNKKFMSVDKI
jgi:hypothetical protein